MNDFDRRTLLKGIAALSLGARTSAAQAAALHVVRNGADRTGQPHSAARADSHIDFKVLSGETARGVFIIENRDMARGGPPRHIHYDQEEWFYLIEGGEVAMEIGDEKLRLKPGDSVLAPRNVPHVWAYLGEQPGRMLFAFTPAAQIEDFFVQQSKPGAIVGDPRVFESHRMRVVGPPLPL